MDGEQLDLVSGKHQKVRRMVKVNMLVERFIYSSQSGCTSDVRLYDYRYTDLLVCLSLYINLSHSLGWCTHLKINDLTSALTRVVGERQAIPTQT